MSIPPVSRHPFFALTGAFLAWKTLLLLLITLSPGPGYDTSSSLLGGQRLSAGLAETPEGLSPRILKLVRWDAVYFTHMSSEGHVFEQEWAFGIGLSGPVSLILRRKRLGMSLLSLLTRSP